MRKGFLLPPPLQKSYDFPTIFSINHWAALALINVVLKRTASPNTITFMSISDLILQS